MISEYIPRGFSKIPLLTLFTLINFFIVFLSCVMTVFVLRLYYRPPSFLQPKEHQLPFYFRLILFKYIGKILGLKFYCRNKKESYHTIVKNSNVDELFESKKFSNFDNHFEKKKVLKNLHKKKLCVKAEPLLFALKRINNYLKDKSKFKEKSNKNEEYSGKYYFEEWKQASLVLDRYLFFVFTFLIKFRI
jgi:hypothetical protein